MRGNRRDKDKKERPLEPLPVTSCSPTALRRGVYGPRIQCEMLGDDLYKAAGFFLVLSVSTGTAIVPVSFQSDSMGTAWREIGIHRFSVGIFNIMR